jgi:hypothetical protein
MALKFELKFQNAEQVDCVVNFFFDNYDGNPITIYGGARPFVLGEFNSDEDLFKPIRPQQATIEILASASGVKLEDFLSEDEDNIIVTFDFGSFSGYWKGFMSQEDMSEVWIATNHILTLRADDGIGRLKNIELGDNDGNELLGVYDFVELLQYATRGSALNFYGGAIISNLFHSSMTDGTDRTGLDQCTADARTFGNAVNEFDDKYRTIEKINRSWNQTMFQWFSQFYVVRVPEMFTLSNMEGFTFDEIGRYTISQRYDVSVGVGELVKPVMPEMIKTYFKPSKETRINYNWEQFTQIVCNQYFRDGTRIEEFIGGTGTERWTVNLWTLQRSSILTPDPSPGVFERRSEYLNYKLQDEYIYIGFVVNDNWARSCNIYVTQNNSIDIDFQYRVESSPGAARNQIVALILLYASDGTKYALNRLRKWIPWTTDAEIQTLFLASSIPPVEWTTFVQRYDDNTEISNEPVPKDGYLNFVFYRDVSELNGGGVYYKDLNLAITSEAERNRRRVIKGDYDEYTTDTKVIKKYNETIFFDDADTNVFKGAIYENNGFTLTGDEWYRMKNFDGADSTAERFTFKRQNALARWFQNRSYKMKLDVNMYGLLWENPNDPPNTLPIGLINTIKFVDDAPGKIFAITNMKEIDFMNNTWSASLIEIFDESGNVNEPTDNDVHSFDYYYE